MHYPSHHADNSLEARIACLLALARLIVDLAGSVPTCLRLKGPRIDRALSAFRAGKIMKEEGDAIEEMVDLVLRYFEKECPGHIETLFRGTVADYPLMHPDWQAVRVFWDSLIRYRMLRQDVLDDLKAEQIAAELRAAGS